MSESLRIRGFPRRGAMLAGCKASDKTAAVAIGDSPFYPKLVVQAENVRGLCCAGGEPVVVGVDGDTYRLCATIAELDAMIGNIIVEVSG